MKETTAKTPEEVEMREEAVEMMIMLMTVLIYSIMMTEGLSFDLMTSRSTGACGGDTMGLI